MKKILGAILALGFVFRLTFLGQRQLWTDELMQAVVIRAGSLDELIRNLRGGAAFPAPLDYLVQKAFVLLLGSSPWALRLHAAVLGTISIWVLYRVASILFGPRVALYSAALFAVYPLHHHYSQEGGPYALLVLLTLTGSYVLLRAVSSQAGRLIWVVGLASAFVLALYTSVLGVAVLGAQLLALLVTAAGGASETVTVRLKRALDGGPDVPAHDLPAPGVVHLLGCSAACVIAAGLCIPWLSLSWYSPAVVPRGELTRPGIVLVALKGIGDNSYPASGILLLGAAIGITALRAHGCRRRLLWLISWPLAYTLAVWIIDYWSGYFFSARQLVPATPALVLLAGYGLAHVGERLTLLNDFPYRLSSPAQVYAAALLVAAVLVAQARWRKDPADWVGLAQQLEQSVRPGDALSMPQISKLVEYHAPRLQQFQSTDLDPGRGSLPNGGRRFVVCYNGMAPDPCAGFRQAAMKAKSWSRRDLPGFTVFSLERR